MSKPAAAAAAEGASSKGVLRSLSQPAAAPEPAAFVHSSSSKGPLLLSPSSLASSKSQRMKGLFKSKPRTPVDIVRQTRDLLIFADRSPSSDSRDAKREEKVNLTFV